MKTPLALLLAISLAGNAVLAVLTLRSANPTTPASAATIASSSAVAAKNGAAATPAAAAEANPIQVTPAVWQALKPNGNLKMLVANLRAAGFPPAVVRA